MTVSGDTFIASKAGSPDSNPVFHSGAVLLVVVVVVVVGGAATDMEKTF
jgi:hypothetical protein